MSAEQVRAYGVLREHVCKKAELECQRFVLEIKRDLIAEGLANVSEMPTKKDDAPPPRPPAKSVSSPPPKSVSPSKGGKSPQPSGGDDGSLYDQPWFHGILARVKVNELLKDNPNCKPG